MSESNEMVLETPVVEVPTTRINPVSVAQWDEVTCLDEISIIEARFTGSERVPISEMMQLIDARLALRRRIQVIHDEAAALERERLEQERLRVLGEAQAELDAAKGEASATKQAAIAALADVDADGVFRDLDALGAAREAWAGALAAALRLALAQKHLTDLEVHDGLVLAEEEPIHPPSDAWFDEQLERLVERDRARQEAERRLAAEEEARVAAELHSMMEAEDARVAEERRLADAAAALAPDPNSAEEIQKRHALALEEANEAVVAIMEGVVHVLEAEKGHEDDAEDHAPDTDPPAAPVSSEDGVSQR